MRRRTVLLGLLTAAGAGGVAACSSGTPSARGSATLSPSPSPSAIPSVATSSSATPSAEAQPVLASTKASSLAPQNITAQYVPVAGTAPSAQWDAGYHEYTFSRGDRRLETSMWYPAANNVPARGRYPLVLFSHGLNSAPSDFGDILATFARAGFVVAAPTYPNTNRAAEDFDGQDLANQPQDASAVIDRLLALRASDPVAAMIDPDRIAAGGHSGGAITTDGLFSMYRDNRLKAGIVISGTDFRGMPFSGSPAAMLFVHGRDDDTVSYRAGHTVFEAVPWSRAFLTVTDGGHDIDSSSANTIAQTSLEFLRWSLYGDIAARGRIPAVATRDGVATFENQL